MIATVILGRELTLAEAYHTGRTISRWRIDGGRSVADTLRLIRRDFPGVTAGQAHKLYVGAQTEPAVSRTRYQTAPLHNTWCASCTCLRRTASTRR